jgi:nucleoside-diphosphate-sugar epimerase
MRVLVTGSSGHLGEALIRTLREVGHEVVGLDVREDAFTTRVGSITDRSCVADCIRGVQAVFHAATLHRPHIETYCPQAFVDTNIAGTLNLLESAAAAGVGSFVFTSTTSVFGDALIPPAGAPAAWVTEEVRPVPKNIYGVTKAAAEDLCQLFHRNQGLPCVVLIKVTEYLHRRVDLEDVVSAHLSAAAHAPAIGFGRYIISGTTPFSPEDLPDLRRDAPLAARRRVPDYEAEYARRGWKMVPRIDRVYVNERARRELGWRPRYDFQLLIERLRAGEDVRSPLARKVGSKGYL